MVEIKECTCDCDENGVLYGNAESLYRIPKTNITLCVDYTGEEEKFLRK